MYMLLVLPLNCYLFNLFPSVALTMASELRELCRIRSLHIFTVCDLSYLQIGILYFNKLCIFRSNLLKFIQLNRATCFSIHKWFAFSQRPSLSSRARTSNATRSSPTPNVEADSKLFNHLFCSSKGGIMPWMIHTSLLNTQKIASATMYYIPFSVLLCWSSPTHDSGSCPKERPQMKSTIPQLVPFTTASQGVHTMVCLPILSASLCPCAIPCKWALLETSNSFSQVVQVWTHFSLLPMPLLANISWVCTSILSSQSCVTNEINVPSILCFYSWVECSKCISPSHVAHDIRHHFINSLTAFMMSFNFGRLRYRVKTLASPTRDGLAKL